MTTKTTGDGDAATEARYNEIIRDLKAAIEAKDSTAAYKLGRQLQRIDWPRMEAK